MTLFLMALHPLRARSLDHGALGLPGFNIAGAVAMPEQRVTGKRTVLLYRYPRDAPDGPSYPR